MEIETEDRKRHREDESAARESAPSWFISFERRFDERFSKVEQDTHVTKEKVIALEDRVSALEIGKGAVKGQGRRPSGANTASAGPSSAGASRPSGQQTQGIRLPANSVGESEAPLSRTLVLGGFDPATRRQCIEDHIRHLIRDHDLLRIEDVYAPQVRCQIGFIRFETSDSMWMGFRKLKQQQANNRLTFDGKELWFSPQRSKEDRQASKRLRLIKEACQTIVTDGSLAWDIDVRHGNVWCGSGKLVIGKGETFELNKQHAQTLLGGDDARHEALTKAFTEAVSAPLTL
eukprot:1895165-Amphidinium_carterae.2